MKKLTLIISLSMLAGFANGQIQWERLFSKKSSDVFRCVQEVSTGGYILAGYTSDSTANDSDAYVVRLNPSGDTIWTFEFNGPLSGKDLLYKVIETSSGDFVACGYTTSATGVSDDFLYMMLNSSGHLQWVKTLGGIGKERAQDIVETSDGFTMAGYTTSGPSAYYDAYIVHTDFNGDTLFTKLIGNANYDDANSLKVLSDGGYIIGGQSSNGSNGLDQFLIRANADGDTLWTKKFGTLQTDNIEYIILKNDGFVLAGSTNTTLNLDDGYLVKTDTSGNVIWSHTYGGTEPDDFHRVEPTADGGYVAVGTTSSTGPLLPNMWLLKTDNTGAQSWQMTFGGDNHDHGYSGLQTSDSYYIIAGHSGSFGFNNEDAYVVKTGPTGSSDSLTYIAAYALASPTCASTTSQVTVVIRNFGDEYESNIPVTVEITGAITQTLTGTFTGVIAAHDLATFTFPGTINTTGGGAITFHGFTGIVNDVVPQNNSFTTTVNLVPCVGIEELNRTLGYKVYPNPSDENITVDFSDQYSKAEIELISSMGSVVKKITVNNTGGLKKQIDISTLAKGFYLLKVSADGYYDVRGLVVE